MTALLAVLGRIEDIQQRIRSVSAEPAAASSTGRTGQSAATGSTMGGTNGTQSASASAFAEAVRDAGEYATPRGGEVTGADIVAQAKNYLGVPYVFGGEDRSGMDCSGLVQRVLADLGIDVPRVVKDQADVGVEVPSLAEAQPGDLIVTKGEGHIVIYAGDGMVIHAPSPGKVVEHRNNWLTDGDIATIRRMVPAAEAAPTASVSPAAAGQAATVTAAGTAPATADRAALAAVASLLSPGAPDLSAPAVRAVAQALTAAADGSGASPLNAAGAGIADSPLGVAIAQAVSRASASATAVAAASPADADAGPSATSLLSGAAASAPSTGAPDAAPPAAAAPAAARSPLAQQLTAPVMSLASRGDGEHTMTVRVSPDDLGPVTVKAHISGGSIAIELVSGSAAGRDALRALLVDLRRDLAVLAPHSTLAVATTDAPRGDQGSTGAGTGWTAGQSASGQSSAGGSGSGGSGAGDPAGHSATRRDEHDAPAGPAAAPSASTAPAAGAAGIDLFV